MKYVSINAHVIRRNATYGTNDPPIRIAKRLKDQKPVYAHEIKIKGEAKLVYQPDAPILACGARMVLIADDVEIVR